MPISEDTHIVSIHSGLDQVLQRKEETDYVTKSCRNQTKLHKLMRSFRGLKDKGSEREKAITLRGHAATKPNYTNS